jgi:uncharacterized protein (DUF2267 family)
MFRRYVKDFDLPLLGDDMDLCQKVFDMVRDQLDIERGSELESQLAANIIQFYKQGIRTEAQLLIMARTSAIS